MKHIELTQEERKELAIGVKKIIGQLQNIQVVIENDKVTEQTFTQLLAVKGGASKLCKEIISKGVLTNLSNYSSEELNQALNIIFKL